jgi:hypothetical protein
MHFTLKIHIKNTFTPLKHSNVCVCCATLHVSANTLDHLQGLFLLQCYSPLCCLRHDFIWACGCNFCNIMFNHNQCTAMIFSTFKISHCNTVIMVIRKAWWVWFALFKLTYLRCHVYLPAAGLVVYCLLTYGMAARTWITGLVHWPAVLLLVYCIGGRFEYTRSSSVSFCCFFCMVSLIAVCFL